MIDREAARQAAEEYANRTTSDIRVVIYDDMTEERPYGWFFEPANEDPQGGLRGGGPILVLKADGSIIQFSSAYDPAAACEAYEANPAAFRLATP